MAKHRCKPSKKKVKTQKPKVEEESKPYLEFSDKVDKVTPGILSDLHKLGFRVSLKVSEDTLVIIAKDRYAGYGEVYTEEELRTLFHMLRGLIPEQIVRIGKGKGAGL